MVAFTSKVNDVSRLILTDCDGVLLNWVKGFSTFIEGKGHKCGVEDSDQYSLERRFGLTTDQVISHVNEFNESDAIRSLEPYADSVEYVKKLSEQGFRFTVISALTGNAKARQNRWINLQSVFGDVFEDLICLPIMTNKSVALEPWKGTNHFWIEDHVEQALAGLNQGLRPILVSHPYNNGIDCPFYRTSYENPWKDIYNQITTE